MLKKLAVSVGVILLAFLLFNLFFGTRNSVVHEMTYSELRRAVEEGILESVMIQGNLATAHQPRDTGGRVFRVVIPGNSAASLADILYQKGVQVRVEPEDSWITGILLFVAIGEGIALVLCGAYIVRRRCARTGRDDRHTVRTRS